MTCAECKYWDPDSGIPDHGNCTNFDVIKWFDETYLDICGPLTKGNYDCSKYLAKMDYTEEEE